MFIKRMPNSSINNSFSWFETEQNSYDEARHVQLTVHSCHFEEDK